MPSAKIFLNGAPTSPPGSPRPKPPASPVRGVSQEERSSIRAVVDKWKNGELDIDSTVQELLPESSRRKSFAREVYIILSGEVRAEQSQSVLIASRKALYAAGIFAKMSDMGQEHRYVEDTYIANENDLVKHFPDLLK